MLDKDCGHCRVDIHGSKKHEPAILFLKQEMSDKKSFGVATTSASSEDGTEKPAPRRKCLDLILLIVMNGMLVAIMAAAIATDWKTANVTIQNPSQNITASAGWRQSLCNGTVCVSVLWSTTSMMPAFFTSRVLIVLAAVGSIVIHVGASLLWFRRMPNEHLRCTGKLLCFGVGAAAVAACMTWHIIWTRDWPVVLDTSCRSAFGLDQDAQIFVSDTQTQVGWYVMLVLACCWLVTGFFIPTRRRRQYVALPAKTDEEGKTHGSMDERQ